MYRPRHRRAPADRRGVILLVVITMLTLFAVVGLTFVAYAESEATASRIYREANDVIPDYYQYLSEQKQPYDLALGQLIYDVDDNTGVDSALRGHSLARSMYGWNDDFVDPATGKAKAGAFNPNTVPYNGVGRFQTGGSTGQPSMNPGTQNDYTLVNYTYHQKDGFIRDPERAATNAGRNSTQISADPTKDARGLWTGGFHAPYTYPDANNMFLAAVRADGTVLVPSFHRPWLGAGDLSPTNPNWQPTPPAGVTWIKYQTLRPLPSQNAGFPGITVQGGDIQNIPNDNGLNDSVWIDLNAPVSDLPDGRRYKAMFAFLVRDLDSLINVNQHGNIALTGQEHAGNQGWGKWEVNLKSLLTADANEWKRIFTDTAKGRYAAGNALPAMTGTPSSYAQYDFDGAKGAANARQPADKLSTLMPAGNAVPFNGFPTFTAAAGYESSGGQETQTHPAAYNYANRWSIDNIKGLMAYGPRDTTQVQPEWKNTELGAATALPTNLAVTRIRNLLTTLSADVDRAGASPYAHDPATNPLRFVFDITKPDNWVPVNNPATFPPVSGRSAALPAGSEFANQGGPLASAATNDWRSRLAEDGRINLNIDFTSAPWAFPAVAAGGQIAAADIATYTTALQKRQGLAKTIFERLRLATGAAPLPAAAPPTPEPSEFAANRWLAQLAVNVVDYIDTDDYMTPFNWLPGTAEYVYGTELPRLVLNEVYAQLNNDPDDLTRITAETDPLLQKAKFYHINVWAEVHNPRNAELPTVDPDTGSAVLMRGTTPVYQIVLADKKDGLRDKHSNTKGDRATGTTVPTLPQPAEFKNTAATPLTSVLPGGGKFNAPPQGNDGFWVIGSDPGMATTPRIPTAANPSLQTTSVSQELRLAFDAPMDATQPPLKPTVLLRKLACDALPPNDNPADTTTPYNPYITVDYVEDVPWRDKLTYDGAGMHDPTTATWMHGTQRAGTQPAVGRKQPLAGHTSQVVGMASAETTDPPGTRYYHTFYRHNVTSVNDDPTAATFDPTPLTRPFDWLLHLNRTPQNPIELLHVSGFKPHELTQQFMRTDIAAPAGPVKFGHEVRWVAPNSPLHRFLELVETREHTGASPGGRVQGKININTIWDKEVFQALVGIDPNNAADAALVNEVWNQIIAQRTPNLAGGTFGNQHRPFTSFASGHDVAGAYQVGGAGAAYPSLLRPVNNESTFVPASQAGQHPYLKYEMLRRILNNTTVRSNVFAVWCTIGYFEVRDETARPFTLGAEIGSEVNRPFRSQFFAIVDRTQLALDPADHTKQASKSPLVVRSNASARAGATVTIQAPPQGTNSEGTWNLRANDTVLVGVGMTGQVWAQVTAVDATNGTFTVNSLSTDFEGPFGILVPHTGDTMPVVPGNPGPQPKFEYDQAPYKGTVVKFFAEL